MQTDILRTALGLIHSAEAGGVLLDYPGDWGEFFEFRPGGNRPAADTAD